MILDSRNGKMGAGVLATRQNLPVVPSIDLASAYLYHSRSRTVGKHSGMGGGPITSYSVRTGPGVTKKLYISIDESGNVGDRKTDRYFVLVACVVTDYKGYTRPTKKELAKQMRKKPELDEIKFNTHISSRRPIIEGVQDSIDYIVYIAVPNIDANKPMKHMMSSRALQRIADFILEIEHGDMSVEIDHTDMVADDLAEAIFEKNPRRGGRSIEADSHESKRSLGLQTHDFITGGIGRVYNRGKSDYFALMTATKISLMTQNEWDSLFTDSIADELRMEDPTGVVDHWEDWNANPEKYDKRGRLIKEGPGDVASLSKVVLTPDKESTHAYKKASSNGSGDRPRDSKGRFVKSDGKRSATVRRWGSYKSPKTVGDSKKSKGGRRCTER